MKKALSLTLFAAPLIVGATSLHVVRGNVEYVVESSSMGEAVYGDRVLSILGQKLPVSEITRMFVSEEDIADNIVLVNVAEDTATVKAAWNILPYVTASVDGGHVRIIQSDDVDASIGEITYVLSGESSNGSIYIEGSYKSSIELRGLNITNPSGAALEVKNGKRISLSVKNGTVNRLEDGSGSQKGALSCTGHLELKGKGELNVKGNVAHAVYSKEYVEVKNLTLNILGAKKDGINCTQYFLMESGSVIIKGIEGDGIQTDYKNSANRDEEDTGTITISGGKLDIATPGTACKGLKAEGCVEILDGEISIAVTGNGEWDSAKSKTKASACIGADADVIISGGNITLNASGSGGKGISCDALLHISGGNIDVTTIGGVLVYQNGSINHNYTGNTDRIASDQKSSPKGMKADGDVLIDGGIINITTSGNGGEGIESKSNMTINDCQLKVYAKDDCLNSSKTMTINGGDILVVSSGNDGLDSNGDMYLRGGLIRAFGAGSPECGIDVNSEEGYVLIITGGNILGVGGNSSIPTTDASLQPYIFGSLTVKASEKVIVSDDDGELYSFEVPEDYISTSGSGGGWRPGGSSGGTRVFISLPKMIKSKVYTVSCDNSNANMTSALKGSGGGMRPW
ncbi:MAG: carbohydrate-binding domain-containing protein [Muribaculaceae bacterium]|nr:carbohydrate-binding domain-containing protein [Muribaculaceae bacterium]